MKTVVVKATFEGTYELEVPEDWTWDGSLTALVEYDELSAGAPSVEIVDWEVVRG